MERVIHRRLMNWLIENKKLHFYQTAFRTHHSTTNQLFYQNQSITDGFQEKPHKKTLAVFLDISAAFDRNWRQKLVHTIQESRRMWAGVPQGSVLSPLLFLIFMNTIHHHIHPDTNIACYADDIAVWYSHNDITELENALNTTLKGIAEWAENLKLTVNAGKANYCIFSADRRHRSSFNANIKIQNSQIKKVDLPTYLRVTLDPELRFSKHIEQTANKALGKLNILRKLCGTSWGSRPQTLKSTFFTKHSTRLKRSLTLQLDSEIRKELHLDHSFLEFLQEPLIPKNPPKNACFELEVLQACSKKEDNVTLRQKGLETIAILSQDNFTIAYTNGSSDRSPSNGCAGIILLLPDDNNYKHKINTEQLHNKRKSCILQWIPAHVNIEGNECADSLAKEARDIEHKCTTITLDDANAVAKHRIMNHTFKKPLVTEFDCPRIITSTIARLRTEHLKGMKIHLDKTRSYVQGKHCPDLQLTPNHILECPTSQQSYYKWEWSL
ncbi:probable RNA-directed DNA polymerase from transposon BS [Trichonephila clavipes]|nr:probable RNA-directed DNA polymerase from transposon BS [Trichonephila clavipes]